MSIRVGQGVDVHAFAPVADTSDSDITLGGVQIPHTRSLMAHSDGDVLLHALCDALLGALALGDIGQHFPDTDPQYANANSRELLCEVMKLVTARGYQLANADMTIVAQQPRMAPYTPAMRENISRDMSVALDAISIKATTSEQLGFTGRGEGIACFAVVLLESVVGNS